MQKIDAMNTQVNTVVTLNRNGKVYKAKVLRAPTFKDGTFRPTQFKLEVQGDDEYSGNRYVSYTAVHTPEADEAQKSRAEAEAKAKLERKVEAETKAMTKQLAKAAKPKASKNAKLTLSKDEALELAKAMAMLDKLGFEVELR